MTDESVDDGHTSACTYQKCAHPELDTPCPFVKSGTSAEKPTRKPATTAAPEHLILEGSGTSSALRCSCGRAFTTSQEARQHQWWNLQLAIAAYKTIKSPL